MAIDPKLVSIIPASQLPTGDPTGAADFLFYEENALKKGSMSNIYDKLISGIKGVATPTSSPTAWATGDPYLYESWKVTQAGTYTNFKDSGNAAVVVTAADLLNNFVTIDVTNGVAAKDVKAMPENTDFENIPEEGAFEIADEGGNVGFSISKLGEVGFSKLKDEAKEIINKSVGFNNADEGAFEIADENGIIAFRITKEGIVDVFNPSDSIRKDIGVSKLNIPSFAVLGDSISTSNGEAGLALSEIWHSKLALKLNATRTYDAVGGSCITSGGKPIVDFCDDARLDTIIAAAPSVIFIFGGINDFGQDIPLGNFGSTDKTNLHGALRYIYNKLFTALPNSKIVQMTPMHTNYTEYTANTVPEYNGSMYLTQYIDVIKEAAKAYGVIVLDTNQECGITQYNINSYAADKIHGNAVYHTIIADYVYKQLKNII